MSSTLFLALILYHYHLPILQVLDDLHTIWDWILIEKLHIPRNERNMYSAVLVMPETFDNRGISKLVHLNCDKYLSLIYFACCGSFQILIFPLLT